MADNVIRIDDDAYRALSGMKTQGDTFNDVVHRVLNERRELVADDE